MLNKKYTPTRLIKPAERPKLVIVEPPASPRFRNSRFTFVFLRWALGSMWLRLSRKNAAHVSARRLREMIEQVGGLWVKVGQLLSLRADFFSPEFCSEMSQLQYRSIGFPWSIARSILETDLGGPIDRYFDDFDSAPFAAASISQVHRAHLKAENAWVAVKIQRPDIQSTFFRDLAFLRFLVNVLRQFRIMQHLRWGELHWEIEQIVTEETDYRYEEANLRRMKKSLRKHRVYIPDVFSRYCTRRVLVMEYIEGALMSDFIEVGRRDPEQLMAWQTENNIVPDLVGARLLESFLRQLIEDNLFHGDLHPGNIILLRNSRFAFIDLGSIGSMERRFLSMYKLSLAAMATRNYQKAADLLLLMCESLPQVDLGEITAEIVRCYRAWDARAPLRDVGYHEKSIGSVASETGQVLYKHRIVASWQFMKMSRTWSTLDASLNYLMPGVNYGKFIARYQRMASERAWQVFRKTGFKGWVNAMTSGVNELLLYRGGILRREAAVYQTVTTKAAYLFSIFFRVLTRVMLLAGVVMLLAFVRYRTGWFQFLERSRSFSFIENMVRNAGPEIWIGLFLILLYLYRVFIKLYKRFSEGETTGPGVRSVIT